MELKELFLYRNQILENSHDIDGYTSESGFIESCLPSLMETKHIDTTDINNVYDPLENGAIKVNAYVCNESGERLQLFIVNEDSINIEASDEQLMISQKSLYEKYFTKALSFVKKSFKKQISELLQDGSPAWTLIYQFYSPEFLDQIDVIEIFLLSATATIQSRGNIPTAKMIEFDDDAISINYTQNLKTKTKELIVIKRLIDLNFLYNVHIAQGSRYPLVIDFTEPPYNYPIPFLQAASENDFNSYLCALPATLLAELYKRHSSRLLEKNVRSFLQLKGVNKGMQDTIRKEPQKFIAYNNGLTITATDNEIIKNDGNSYIKSLSDFQIVNGGQTTATLYFSKKIGLNIDSIQVMAKINVVKDASEDALDELISNISTFSNAQSKVSKVDLRARSPQLVKLKSLSESVSTASGKKWFFERAKGEFATMMRINSDKKSQLDKAYPKERRFTKEELAKYYCAWGNEPYAVKRGGEKIFRLFLEVISGDSKATIVINRDFYEDLIARIILFRSLENIYGAGSNSLGQLRSAVVPYSLSAVFSFTNGDKKAQSFDLQKIWKAEKIEDDLQSFFRSLMILMNVLIKKFSKSDDLGEYSKRPELWSEIVNSKELEDFMGKIENKVIIRKFSISIEEMKRRQKEALKIEVMDFEPLLRAAEIFDRGADFYKSILNSQFQDLSDSETLKLNEIISAIYNNRAIESNYIAFEKAIINEIVINDPSHLPSVGVNSIFKNTVEFIIRKYNNAVSSGKGIQATFDAIKEFALKKGVLYHSIFGEIGKSLERHELPSMQQIKQATEYCKILES